MLEREKSQKTYDFGQLRPGHSGRILCIYPFVSTSTVTKKASLAQFITMVTELGYAPEIRWVTSV